jgi:hypothetical protein
MNSWRADSPCQLVGLLLGLHMSMSNEMDLLCNFFIKKTCRPK